MRLNISCLGLEVICAVRVAVMVSDSACIACSGPDMHRSVYACCTLPCMRDRYTWVVV
jgi:hypothetical protein